MTANSLAKMITLVDAVHMLHQAWLDVKQQTIVNCFKKAGFVPEDDNSDYDSDGTEAYDLDDDDIQPPDALTTEEFEDFVAVDDTTAPCHGMPTDEEICASVKASDAANEGQSVDENVDTDSKDEELPPPPTAVQAMAALKTLRHWMEIGNCTDFTAFYKLENTVQSMVAGVRHQTKINDYFQ